MKDTKEGLDLIKGFESLQLKAYKCPAGIWTIGYGHTGPDVYEGQVISVDQADMLLKLDVARFENCVNAQTTKSTPQQFAAMVSLAYNIGEGNFKKSSVLRLHNLGKYAEAAQAFALWNKAGGKVLPGLVKRRAAEAALYLSDLTAEETPQALLDAPTASGEEPLSKSRTINGQVAAGATTAITVAAQQINDNQDNLGDMKDTVMQFLPYITQYSWMILLAAGAFLAYSIYARYNDRHNGRS